MASPTFIILIFCRVFNFQYASFPQVVGYQGAILRKLEYQSQATISLDIEKILRFETERPETSSLTAHRLVAAALGMSPKLDEEKSKAEHEKLAFARDVASRYKVSTKQHDVKISGSPDAVSTAKKLINQIVNFTTLLAVPLPGFAIDEVIEISGAKLKTIETLLNVILRLEELDDQSVVLHLSGDAVSCEDAKKLILEELGQVSAAQGQLMLLPGTLRHILTTKESMDRFIRKLGDLSGARIRLLTDEKCRFLFFTGYSDRVYKARRIINKINTNLLFTPADSTQSGTSDDDNDKAKSKTVEYVLHTMEDLCKREHSLSRQVSQDQVPHVSKRKFYSRLFLVHRWSSPEAWKFPDSLQKILDGNDEESKMIIVKEGIPMCDLLFLTSEEGPSRTRPSIS